MENILVGIVELGFTDEFFMLVKNEWAIQLAPRHQTLLRIYDETHELLLLTRTTNDSTKYYLYFGTYEHIDSTLVHHTQFDVELPTEMLCSMDTDELIEFF
ncbi:hypothetical protein [Enterococcus rivorum]